MRNHFTKFLLMAIFVVMAMVMASVGISAAPVDATTANESYEAISYEDTVVYDGTGDTFEEIVETALASGKNTIIELKADVVYTDTAREIHHIGEAYAGTTVPTNTIKVTSGTNVDGNGKPYGMVFTQYTILNVYGNYVFDDIKFDFNANWTTGGVIQVTKGSITVGHPNEVAEGETADYGYVYMPTQASLMGQNLNVYTGGNDGKVYRIIAANFYNVGLTVENPSITVGGNAQVQALYAGLLAYSKNNPTAIVGRATLKLLDEASVSDAIGITRDTNVINEDGADIEIDTDGSVGTIEVIGRTGTRYDTANYGKLTPDKYDDFPTYTLTINKVTVSSSVSMGYIRQGNPRINFIVDINGGTFNGPVYLGYRLADGNVENAYNIRGKLTATIDNATFTNTFFCGSYLVDNTATYGSNEQLEKKVTITDCAFNATANIANSGIIWGGSLIKDDNVMIGNSKTDEGALELIINGSTSCVNVYGGSLITSDKSDYTPAHKSPTNITINGITTSSHIYGGSKVISKGGKHTGAVTTTINGGSFGGRMFGGSQLNAVDAKQEGDTTLKLEGTFTYPTNAYFLGGSLLSKSGVDHSGDSTIEVNTSSLKTHSGFYGGSWADVDGATHSGNSKLEIKAGNDYSAWMSERYGGSFLNNVNTKHTGNSEIIFNNDITIGGGSSFGGSKFGNRSNGINVDGADTGMMVGTAEKPVSLKVTINCVDSEGNDVRATNGAFYAGCSFTVTQATIYGDTYLNVIRGKIGTSHGAGSIAASSVLIKDTDENDGFTGGFAQIGDVHYTVSGGTIGGTMYGAGNKANVDGDVNFNISGGTFDGVLYALTASKTEGTSCTGDVIFKVTGGTFNNTISLGGGYATAYKTNGNNVVGGNVYSEFVNDGIGEEIVFNYTGEEDRGIYFDPAGRGLVKGEVYVKLVGNVPQTDSEGNDYFTFNYGGNMSAASKTYLDLLHYTGETLPKAWTTGSGTPYFDVTIYPLNNADVTLASADVASGTAVSDLIANLTFGGATYSYADITKFDDYTDYENALKVYSTTKTDAPITTIGALTESITIKVPSVNKTVIASNAIALNNADSDEKAAYDDVVIENYEGKAFSMRTRKDGAVSYGLRYRARISKDFIDTYTSEFFRIREFGIKVSAEINGTPRILEAVAWQDGTHIEWMTDDTNDPGYYLFAAVITGFDGDVERYAQEFTFDVYLTYEDASGETVTLSIGSPVTNSLKGVATALATGPAYAEWYTKYKDEVDAVVNA